MNYEKCSIFSNSQEDLDVLLGQSMLGRQGQGYIPCKYQFWTQPVVSYSRLLQMALMKYIILVYLAVIVGYRQLYHH